MNIKAQGLLHAAEELRTCFGIDALAEVLQQCDPAVRQRCMTASTLEWHPADEFEQFLRAAGKVVGGQPGKLAYQLGAAGARKNTSGFLYDAAFYFARREYAASRIASAWTQFNSEGTMKITTIHKYGIEVSVSGHRPPGPLFCLTLNGWCDVLSTRIGLSAHRTEHVACVLNGQPACVWQHCWH